MKSISSYLVSILVFCIISINAEAQMQSPKVPIDKDVITGTLDNGLKYYIRHNNLPKERADFYIVHNVGAILETDAQNGLAHFCEHMAFNGTKNFPKKGVLNFLERIGVKFGHNVNAFTGQDVTCYNLNDVPATNELWLDSALLVLHDWSHYVSFEDEEIDAERGVIHEEWRTRRNANFRMQKKNFPTLFNNSKYAERDVIGELEVIDHCSYETMRSFYHDWYRTDLQAIIIVGDIDAKKMEQKVIDLFSNIPRNENAKERYQIEIPDNKEPLVSIATDPEASSINIQVMYKHDIIKPENKDKSYMMIQLMRQFASQMLNNRFAELLQTENPPFVVAQGGYGSLCRTKDAFQLFAIASPKKEELALTTLLTEAEKIKRFGFTASELERVKKTFVSSLETQYKDKDNRKNNSFVWQYFGNFLTNEPIPSLDFEYKFYNQIVPFITIEQINALASTFVTDENIVVTITGPEKDKADFPTKETILETISNVKKAKLEAYKEEKNDKPLIASIPTPGKVVKEKQNEKLGATEWTLSNGMKVIYKQTDFKDDQILMSAYSFGGTSLYDVKDIPSAEFATSLIGQYGIGDFNAIALQKLLAGKVVSVTPQIKTTGEGFRGKSSVADLETMLQLTNLYFTNPRFDETAHNAYMQRLTGYFKNMSANPRKIFSDSVSVITKDHNPRIQPVNLEYLKNVDFNTVKKVFTERFADASDFTFIFVGSIDVNTFKPLVETYLASLPNKNTKEHCIDNKVRAPKTKVEREIQKKLEIPKNTIAITYNDEFDYNNYSARMNMEAISHILTLRYTDEIREKEGGSYGVGVRVVTNKYPWENYTLLVQFDCAPENSDKLKGIVYQEIEKIIKKGPSATDLDKAKKYFIKSREEKLKENNFWLRAIENSYANGENTVKLKDYNDIINKLTIKSVKKTAKKYIDLDKHVEVIMTPIK